MCGAQWPESSLFSLFMNMSAVMSAFLSYFRFRQVIYQMIVISNSHQGLMIRQFSSIEKILEICFRCSTFSLAAPRFQKSGS